VRLIVPYQTAGVRQAFQIQNITALPPSEAGATLLLQRHVPSLELAPLRQWLQAWKSAGGRLAYDIDDDMLDAATLRARHFAGDADEVVERVHFLAAQADLVMVSTPSLAAKLRNLNANVVLLPNTIDRVMWGLQHPRRHNEGEFARRKDVIRIGYIGTPTHDADLDLITPAMKALESRFGSRIQIEVIGGFEKRPPTFGKRVGLPRKSDYPNFVRWLQARVHWDIGVIPLVDDEFNRSKSYLKFLECAALDMALVVSDVPTYRGIARHKENCLLAKPTTEDWIAQLTLLIEDSDLRGRLASQARQAVTGEHTTESVSNEIVDKLLRVAKAAQP
jgi:glycosyltransferase involved in cell wall biosynthesis